MCKIKILIFILFVIVINYGCITGCASKRVKTKEQKVVENLIKLYGSKNWDVRREAIRRASAYKFSKDAEGLLIEALNDSYSTIRIEAIKGIGELQSEKAKKRIKRIAQFEKNSNVRWSALECLGKYREPTASPIFAKGLMSNDWLIREESIKGLLLIDDIFIRQVSTPYIIKALKDKRINVILTALEYLKFKNIRIYRVLAGILKNKHNAGKINLLKATLKALNGYLLDKKTRKKIIGFLTQSNREIRIISLSVLKKDKMLQEDKHNY